jgi:hypothetical protein
MSKGHFDVKDEKSIFCVPYPYEEYQKYIQRLERPTNSQIMESFESHSYDFKEDFEYIEFNKSPEASFTQAYEHVKSYKHIQKELNNAEKTHQNFIDFWKKNEDNARAIGLRMINREKQPEPFYSEYMALAKIATDALQSFQKSCEILAEKLDDGTYIKGTCEFCR